MTQNEATILAAVLGGLAGAAIGTVTSIFTTRYMVKKGPNYSEQIREVNNTLDLRIASVDLTLKGRISDLSAQLVSLTDVQDQHFKKTQEFREREYQDKIAQNWKPAARIESNAEQGVLMNTLILEDQEDFALVAVYIQTKEGATLMELPIPSGVQSMGFTVPIPHEGLLKVKQSEGKGGLQHGARGQLEYKVNRQGKTYQDRVQFTTEDVMVGNTIFTKILG